MTAAGRRNTLLATLAAIPMLLFLDVVTGVNAFYVRDMMHYHFPCKKILREIVLSGHFPYWNPWFSAGQPMAANPAHEVFYPLTWLILLPDYVYALQLLPVVHIVIATFTMYALLRSMDMGRPYGLRMTISGDFDRTELAPSSDFSRAVFELGARKPDDWLNIAVAMSNIRYIGIYRRPDEAMAQAAGVVRNLQPVKFVEGHHYPRYYFASEMAEARDVEEFVGKLVAGRFGKEVAFVGSGAFAPARGVVNAVHEWTNGARIDVAASGRAFLVLSVTPHKYWRVTVDGKPAQAVVTNVAYQGVVVPAGRHIVEMRYCNPLIAAGGAISIAALAAVAFVFCRMRGL